MTSTISRSSLDRLTRTSKASSSKSEKWHRAPAPKKVIISKNLPANNGNKSYSAGLITSKPKPISKPKKTIKSDFGVTKTTDKIDYCKNCGDVLQAQGRVKPKMKENEEDIKTMIGLMNERSVRNDNNVKVKQKSVQQYYKNENFHLSTESVHDPDKIKSISLDPIREVLEGYTEDPILRIYTDSEDDTSLDIRNIENIQELKEFRRKNYFECHSATSRINTKPSATSLKDHRCVYRFYLNDRLFPVPLNADYNQKIRCVECHLPMDAKHEYGRKSINGTIQAKVKLGTGEARDMTLLLPVKDTLIIEEKRRQCKKPDEEIVYFGVIKLSDYGNSMVNNTLPHDSLALKYQKGYKEFTDEDRYCYKNLNDDDVIVI